MGAGIRSVGGGAILGRAIPYRVLRLTPGVYPYTSCLLDLILTMVLMQDVQCCCLDTAQAKSPGQSCFHAESDLHS